jgi:hypothetical protein
MILNFAKTGQGVSSIDSRLLARRADGRLKTGRLCWKPAAI